MTYGQCFLETRIVLGLSVAEMAERLGIPAERLGRIEREKIEPTAGQLIRCQVIGGRKAEEIFDELRLSVRANMRVSGAKWMP